MFRHEFLSALQQDVEVLETRSAENFTSCIAQLRPLTETVALGKPVPDAFSLKIQRKLASTVPPRPMVNITSDDALAHLKRLCQDAIDMQQMLDYTGPSNFKACTLELESSFGSNLYYRLLYGLCFLANHNHQFIFVAFSKH